MPPTNNPELGERMAALGRSLGARESEHRDALDRARACAESLRGQVRDAVDRFHAAAEAGAPHLRIEVSEVRPDDKHLRAVEFDLLRGRYKAIVVAKARGDVTLVGPFHVGKDEGPCRSFPATASAELSAGLAELLERFVEEAATP